MMILISGGTSIIKEVPHKNLGSLITPRTGNIPTKHYRVWAMDNDCFNKLDAKAYIGMMDRYQHMKGCVFCTAPDVVGDALATLKRFYLWRDAIQMRGLPVGFVLQDGCEKMPISWHHFDALFIGGSTEFKLGKLARTTIYKAKEQSKWVHMGRVNSLRRFAYAQSIGCDSVDGSGFSKFGMKQMTKFIPYLDHNFTYQYRIDDFLKVA